MIETKFVLKKSQNGYILWLKNATSGSEIAFRCNTLELPGPYRLKCSHFTVRLSLVKKCLREEWKVIKFLNKMIMKPSKKYLKLLSYEKHVETKSPMRCEEGAFDLLWKCKKRRPLILIWWTILCGKSWHPPSGKLPISKELLNEKPNQEKITWNRKDISNDEWT